MGKEIELHGFLLGVLVGSAVSSLLLLTHGRSSTKDDDCKSDAADEELGTDAQDRSSGADDQESDASTGLKYFEGPLNDTYGRHHRHDDSNGGDSYSVTSISRRSFTLDDDESSVASLSKKKCYAENPDAGTNVQVITSQDWATDDVVIQQAKEFEVQMLNKLRDREEMVMALRRTRAVNALAHTLTVAKDEKACFEVASRLLVPLFKIDGCAFVLTKVRENTSSFISRHIFAH